MTKQRLMLSAAAGALLASALAVQLARADTDITAVQKSAVSTASGGNITIESAGSVEIGASGAAVQLNSNNFVYNAGSVSNNGNSGAIGLQIDTTSGNIVSPAATATTPSGLYNIGTVSLTGEGTGKVGVLVGGSNTFFGPINLGTVTSLVANGNSITPVLTGSSVLVQGDGSFGFYLVQGTTVDGDVSLGGNMTMAPSNNSQGSNSVLVNLDGVVNGNLVLGSGASFANIGSGARGVQMLGGVHTCDTAAVTGVGQTCASNSLGAFINQASIQTVGVQFADPKRVNPEGGSALVIGGSIDGGFVNAGPATSNAATTAAVIAANGVSGAPTFLIDPSQALSSTTGQIRGPIIIGPVASAIDSVDPGYSFINRGTISALPTDGQLSSSAVVIVGSSAANFTCLGSYSGGACTGGGLLNTGSIIARAGTTQELNPSTGAITAVGLSVGAYATVPRIDISGETTTGSATTPGTIAASVQGIGQGNAAAIVIGQNATVQTINVMRNASVIATVSTATLSPTNSIANTTVPFVLLSEAIVDNSGTLKTINNAGSITALNSQLTPAAGAVVINTARAIDLLSSTASGIVINNSGVIQGDVLFGTVGNNDIFNIGNVGAGGTAANPVTGALNTPNAYATVAASATVSAAGLPPLTTSNVINFGTGTGQQLNIGGFGYVNSVILAGQGGLDVNIYNNGTLFVANTAATGPVNAHDFNVNGGTLGLTLSQQTGGSIPIIAASNSAFISPGAKLGLQFGSFVSSGTTAASVNNPVPQNIVLVTAPIGHLNIAQSTLDADNAALAGNIPFLFQPTASPLSRVTSGGKDSLVIVLTPKSPTQLGLTGDAAAVFPYAVGALGTDPLLGAAIAGGIVDGQSAQRVFSQFSPDVSGGAREVAVMMTDQATGPVGARQRLLRSYANQPGEMTLWGEEFAANINNKGRVDADGTITAFKDHGFGFAVGVDAGSSRGGWYGGALSFYSGDVTQSLPRATKTNAQWYMATGYTDWRGAHVFLDTQLSIAYGDFTGHRDLLICGAGAAATCATPALARQADSKRAGLLGAAGATTGVFLRWGGMQVIPHIGLDILSMREEGYTETGGGDGMDLTVEPYYASSVRTAVGADFKGNIKLWDFSLSPEARLGYRYDFIGTPVKLKAGFASTGGTAATGNAFTFTGPDPDTGNLLAGVSLGASTDTWQFGLNYDWVRGNNGSTTQVGMVTVLGRI